MLQRGADPGRLRLELGGGLAPGVQLPGGRRRRLADDAREPDAGLALGEEGALDVHLQAHALRAEGGDVARAGLAGRQAVIRDGGHLLHHLHAGAQCRHQGRRGLRGGVALLCVGGGIQCRGHGIRDGGAQSVVRRAGAPRDLERSHEILHERGLDLRGTRAEAHHHEHHRVGQEPHLVRIRHGHPHAGERRLQRGIGGDGAMHGVRERQPPGDRGFVERRVVRAELAVLHRGRQPHGVAHGGGGLEVEAGRLLA